MPACAILARTADTGTEARSQKVEADGATRAGAETLTEMLDDRRWTACCPCDRKA